MYIPIYIYIYIYIYILCIYVYRNAKQRLSESILRSLVDVLAASALVRSFLARLGAICFQEAKTGATGRFRIGITEVLGSRKPREADMA